MYLHSDSDDDEDPRVGLVHITDGGNKSQCAKVVVGGVPLLGVVDSGADITIMGSTAFKQVAKLRKRDLRHLTKYLRIMIYSPFMRWHD